MNTSIIALTSLLNPYIALANNQRRILWADGHSVIIEFPEHITNFQRRGYHAHIIGIPGTSNRLHYKIPTPTLKQGQRLYLNNIILRLKSHSDNARITAITAYDNQKSLYAKTGLNLHGNLMDKTITLPTPRVSGKIDLSIEITFGREYRREIIELLAVGCEFLIV